MLKNDILTLDITDITTEGEGIGKADGFPLFVKDTIPGDVASVKVIKLKKNYGYGRLVSLIKPSADRVEEKCPISRACGGCQLQAMSYDKQLEFKQKKVLNNLKRIGGLNVYAASKKDDWSEEASKGAIPVFETIGMDEPWHYRNKSQLPVGLDKDGGLVAGFYAGRTHCIIPQDNCLIADKKNQPIIDAVLTFMRSFNIKPYDEEKHSGLVRHILIRAGHYTGEIMVCLVINGRDLPHKEELVKALLKFDGMSSICLNINTEKTNVILGHEVIDLYGKGYIIDKIVSAPENEDMIELSFEISPLSFFQVNPVQTGRLYRAALDFAGLTGGETVWDLYCGIGTISLFLAKKAGTVRGVEIVPQAIENAKKNARRNGINNTEFYVGKAEEVLPAIYEKEKCHADVIVVDPPRKGCDELLLETITRMSPKRVVYVSCDSATLARDLKWFNEHGYETRKVQPVDMFCQGVHVESVVLLTKVHK